MHTHQEHINKVLENQRTEENKTVNCKATYNKTEQKQKCSNMSETSQNSVVACCEINA